MKRRRVLVVCMLDSIHAGRWLAQFKEENIDFAIFPSKKHKAIHEILLNLLKTENSSTYTLAKWNNFSAIYGYVDYVLHIFLSRVIKRDLRLRSLRKIIAQQRFDYVHALEIQGSGYLCESAIQIKEFDFDFIVTNWGSDIYYFQKFPEDLKRIRLVLDKATSYSAECNRDYILARELGFSGRELPCIPNAGGFDLSSSENQSRTSSRNQIIVKTYGGEFGRGELAIEAIREFLRHSDSYNIFFYSVTDDLEANVQEIALEFPERIKFATRRAPLSHGQLRDIFLSSRIYIGASISDGVSTSFLESLTYGTYPIQTETSCAGEWVSIGAVASIVPLEYNAILAQIQIAATDDNLVDGAQIQNRKIAREKLSHQIISNQARNFYLPR